jgi:hypothetical protein
MTISPGTRLHPGFALATMQIYSVRILEKPKVGEPVMVGTGFRYVVKPGFAGTDKFTLMVVGKNLREEGSSSVEITVSPLDARPKAATVSQLDSALTLQQAKAEAVR